MTSRADIACAIIAKNAERTIGPCLDSLVPFVKQVVVCVDATTTDNTSRVAMEHGAEVKQGHRVSYWHECEKHGKVLAQNFAEARNASFAHLRPDTEWLMWVDADDTLRGGQHLDGLTRDIPEHIAGVWLPYQYASAPNGAPTTLFDRERLLRRSVGWHWQNRVHELAVPNDHRSDEVPWIRTDDIVVVHQGANHDDVASAKRNILILEICLEENPGDPWALQYLGNQYYALSDWQTALQYYDAALSDNAKYARWVSYLQISNCYEKMNDLGNAEQAAFAAIGCTPEHPDPFYRLAQIAMLKGDNKGCEVYTKIADALDPPPKVVFQNPLERLHNSKMTLGQAYFNDSQVSKARKLWEEAYATVPSDTLKEGIEKCKELEADAIAANSIVDLYRPLTDSQVRQTFSDEPIAPNIWRFGRARDAIVPALLRTRAKGPRIVFWCGKSAESWAPDSMNTSGIGGSETAVIEIARRLRATGWNVDVYNDADKYEGEYDGVGYWDLRRFNPAEPSDVFVSWRNVEAHGLSTSARSRLLWMHDLNRGPLDPSVLRQWDLVLGVSRWHADYLVGQYGVDNVDFVPNGIDLNRFAARVPKVAMRCVYASSPDRGLTRLLRLWPEILKADPGAELNIAYGWDTIDRYIQLGFPGLRELKEEVRHLLSRTPQVVWRGRLPQNELARLYQESYAWLYPTSFTEVSCISAMEAMAGGAVPVTSAVGALPETIGDGGIIVPGMTHSKAWEEFWVFCARSALTDPMNRTMHLQIGKERVKDLTWDKAAEKWAYVISKVLEGERVCV